MGGLEFGVNQPADIAVLLWTNHLPVQQQSHIYLTMDASQSYGDQVYPALPPQNYSWCCLQPTGKPSRREGPRSHTSDEGTRLLYPVIPKYITKWAGSVLCLPLKNGLATRGHSGKRIPSKPPCPPLGVEANLVSFLE